MYKHVPYIPIDLVVGISFQGSRILDSWIHIFFYHREPFKVGCQSMCLGNSQKLLGIPFYGEYGCPYGAFQLAMGGTPRSLVGLFHGKSHQN